VILIREGNSDLLATICTVQMRPQQCVPQGRPSLATATKHIDAFPLAQAQLQQMRQFQMLALSHSHKRGAAMRSWQKQQMALSAVT
jgi:hypothetical protein